MLHISAAKTVNKKAELLQTVTFSFSLLHTQTKYASYFITETADDYNKYCCKGLIPFAKMVSISTLRIGLFCVSTARGDVEGNRQDA